MKWVLAALAGYLLGSISSSITLSKALYLKDIRRRGSGNAGATNMARVWGMGAGIATLCGDMAKTALAAYIGWRLLGDNGLFLACGAALIGHCWPVWYHFRGGKGVSVSACIALLLDWRFFLILLFLFAVIFLLGRRVSLCSVILAILYPVIYIFGLGHGWGPGGALCCGIAAVVIFCHRSNIARLLKGEEPPFRPGNAKK